jgi:hypothetical protein
MDSRYVKLFFTVLLVTTVGAALATTGEPPFLVGKSGQPAFISEEDEARLLAAQEARGCCAFLRRLCGCLKSGSSGIKRWGCLTISREAFDLLVARLHEADRVTKDLNYVAEYSAFYATPAECDRLLEAYLDEAAKKIYARTDGHGIEMNEQSYCAMCCGMMVHYLQNDLIRRLVGRDLSDPDTFHDLVTFLNYIRDTTRRVPGVAIVYRQFDEIRSADYDPRAVPVGRFPCVELPV